MGSDAFESLIINCVTCLHTFCETIFVHFSIYLVKVYDTFTIKIRKSKSRALISGRYA